MTDAQKTIAQLAKANGLVNIAMHANGPKSFKNGLGALMVALYRNDGVMTQRELINVLGMGRKGVKTIVKKGMRAELVTIVDTDQPKTYLVSLTEEGKAVAEKRMQADAEAAKAVLVNLTDAEIEQLNALTEKIILGVKDMGVSGMKKSAFKHRHGKKGHGCCRKHGRK